MHTVLALSGLLVMLLGGAILLRLLRYLGHWPHRRWVQSLVLLFPLFSLGLGLLGLHHFLGEACLRTVPVWDVLVQIALPLAMGSMLLLALSFGLLRLALFIWTTKARAGLTDPDLEAHVAAISARQGVRPPQVRLCLYDRPLALTYGIFRPTLLLSTWMLDQLDDQELEAVLAHELEHVARHDYLLGWLATVLRDAFFYVPTSHTAYCHLQHERELACDDGAASATRRPLALASALAKVWCSATSVPSFVKGGTALFLVPQTTSLQGRIDRLLAQTPQRQAESQISSSLPSLGIGGNIALLLALIGAEMGAITLGLGAMGCSPFSILTGLIF